MRKRRKKKQRHFCFSCLRAPRRPHRRRGVRRRPPGGPGPPAPRPQEPRPTGSARLRSAALGSRPRPPGGRGVSGGAGRRRGRRRPRLPWGAQRSPVTKPRAPLRRCRGRTPLHFAAVYGHVACAQQLLAAKASLEIKDGDGWGPQPMSRFGTFFSPAITITINNKFSRFKRYNRCSSTNVACLNDHMTYL